MKELAKHEATSFGDWSYLAVAKHCAKMLKHEPGVLEDQDPEELHQMRVGMRRLRSAMTGFALAVDLPTVANQKKVGKVARTLGVLRDIDVLQEALQNKYQPNLPLGEQEKLGKALEVLKTRRRHAFKKVKKELNNKLYNNLKEGLDKWLESPEYQSLGGIKIQEILPDLLLPEISKLLLHPGWLVGIKIEDGEINLIEGLDKGEVEEILDHQGEMIHDLRKEAKRVRYQMELFTHLYGDSYKNYVKDVKELQSVLGDIQDCFVLAEFLTEAIHEDLRETVPNLANLLQETRYDKWQEWNKLQRKFLHKGNREELHKAILNPIISVSELEIEEEKQVIEV